MQQLSSYIILSDEVQTALQEQRPLVALESTVIAHGLPYPSNIEVAQAMEATIRSQGAVPATIGIRDGKIKIGLTLDEITRLGTAQHVQKVSRRDLAFTLATGQLGATTVAGPVIGWQTDEFPAFYVRHSGRHLPLRANDVGTIAAIARTQWECHLHGLVVGCPIPEQYAMDPAPLEAATEEALRLARELDIRGAATTPFLLAHVAKVTAGESVEANKALLVNNALWAARFARAYYALL